MCECKCECKCCSEDKRTDEELIESWKMLRGKARIDFEELKKRGYVLKSRSGMIAVFPKLDIYKKEKKLKTVYTDQLTLVATSEVDE
jgi:hypothetical protein